MNSAFAQLLAAVQKVTEGAAAAHADDVDTQARFPIETLAGLREYGVLSAAVPQRNYVGVLVDDSRSMRIADRNGTPRSDWIEHAFGGAARADGLHESEAVEVPVAIPHLDVHLATGIVGGKQHGWLLAVTLPAVGGRIGADGTTGVGNGERGGIRGGMCGRLRELDRGSESIVRLRITREISHEMPSVSLCFKSL